jgi:hypothetical protein
MYFHFTLRECFAAMLPSNLYRARGISPPEGWISLDSLVRIETFQWVARHEARKLFLGALRAVSSAGMVAGRPRFLACGRRRIVHGASLTRFLILCNKLSSEPFPSAVLMQK